MTRIIAGTAGGRRIAVPAGRGTRPTSDRTREGLFATILAAAVLGETVRRRRWTATIVGFIGVLIVLRPGVVGFEIGEILALTAAFLTAVVLESKPVLHHNPNSPLPWYGATGILACVASLVVLTVLHIRQRRSGARQKLAAASPGTTVASGRP